jgi:hypothetical protein
MKTTLVLSVLLSIAAHITSAQAYWVIETNTRQKNFTIVRFYDQHHRLLYEERQQGVFFDPSKRKHKKRLNEMLSICLALDTVHSSSVRSVIQQKPGRRDRPVADLH